MTRDSRPAERRSPLRSLRNWARSVRRDALALWLAARDPRVPLAAKLICGVMAAYALSPIDLIPDFIPVLGYLDELILLPLGMMIAVRLIPPDVMCALRAEAERITARPTSRAAAVAIPAIWLGAGLLLAWLAWPRLAALLH